MNRRRRRSVDPKLIDPLHSIKPSRRAELRELMQSMAAHGWIGRPLLVEQKVVEKDGDHGRYSYQAWTGTHRLAAARRLHLRRVPIIIISRSRWIARWGPPKNSKKLLIDEIDEETFLRGIIARDIQNLQHVATEDSIDAYIWTRRAIGVDLRRYMRLAEVIGYTDDLDKWVALEATGDKLATQLMKQEIELNLCGDKQGCL